ncbi:low temperature requirement protein A [Catellatospora sp. KI3]|uniref:low temperature requirement protein A n=1 Tax=Catellatospora sp. KI3 TaxID=3041620 RepID=UPI002482BAD4|nr:low temperature requirement protein A [Catellatospora sp. KI3]MDI1464492.1 low temperature requirement protein A [Catellatospora sp. KI3]
MVPSPTSRLYRPMTSRQPHEPHRASTPLELFFDLCFVVAVAQAAAHLHHDVTEGHIGHGVLGYLTVFFAVWWAWMNFTWFASAYDTDDVPYRLTTLVQIAGALTLAAGVPSAFDDGNFTVITVGYVIMRMAMVAQWLRVSRQDPPRRMTALRFAAGITGVQLGWVARLALPDDLLLPAFFVLVLCELAVPLWAERAAPTRWHPHHIAERYGLFTLIVLGESVLAATLAIESGLGSGHDPRLVGLALAGLVTVFAMWWLYFDRPAHDLITSTRAGFRWGYGHYAILASAAAVGAGLAVSVDYDTHASHLSGPVAGYATAVPVAVYLLSVWLLQVLPRRERLVVAAYPVAVALVLLAPLTGAPVHVIAAVLALLVALVVATGPRTR